MRFAMVPVWLLAAGLQAQVPQHLETGFRAISQERLRIELKFLASPALDGRLSLQKGADAAMEWAASEFAKIGLKPAAGGSFLQTVPLVDYRADREASGVLLAVNGKTERFPANISFPNDAAIRGRAILAGFGISAPELKYDDYQGVDVRGKIAVVFTGEPQDENAASVFNGKGATRYRNNIYKAFEAQRRGAIALVVIPAPNAKRAPRPAAQTGVQRLARRSTQALAEGGPAIPVAVADEKAAAALFQNAPRPAAELQSAIDSAGKPIGQPIELGEVEVRQVIAERRRMDTGNVVGILEGSDPSLRNETVIYSAHYDHDGPAPEGGFYPGADDDGSGAIGVIELARAFAANPVKPKRSLLFALFAAEERGLLGSYYYAARPLRPLATTRAVINFDMIGRNEEHISATKDAIEIAPDTSNEMNLVGAKYSPEYKSQVEKWNEFIGLRLSYKWDDEATQNVFFRSDQYPFIQKGVPAMWWFTGFHPDYHQTTDTWDRINYPKLEKILKLAYLTGFHFADAPKPPAFVPAR
ncbi:MAG: M28 family peptidase [Bryobacteraceae bacterium]|nr:M28 family peptidase [Bryobacteraceae bacterium]